MNNRLTYEVGRFFDTIKPRRDSMYNVYQDGKKVGQTSDKTHAFSGLQPGTTYKLGVAQVIDGQESTIVEVKGRTSEHEEIVEGEMEGLSVDGTGESTTDGLNDVSAYHIGGGYYELPNGEKVRGKEAAQLKLDEM